MKFGGSYQGVEKGTTTISEAARLIQLRARKNIEHRSLIPGSIPVSGDRDFAYFERMKALAENGLPSLKTAPYYIVVAEYQGILPVGAPPAVMPW
jgi:hypothetical protein